MKRTILSLLVVGLFTGAGTSAMAQNVTAGTQPNADADSATQQPEKHAEPTMAKVDQSREKAAYNTAKAKAQSDFKDAKMKCHGQQGDAMRTCMMDAKTSRTEALALAKSQWDDRDSAQPGTTSTLPLKRRTTEMK
jgi:hypothetical protein